MQLWQVPLLAMAVVSLAELATEKVLRKWPKGVNWRLMRAVGFGAAVLVASTLILINYLSEADKIANIASAIATVATLWLTYRSFRKPGADDSRQQSAANPDARHRSSP
jgi:hypothetical protein